MTPGGNAVRAYSAERTLCDILRTKNHTDVQIVSEAFKRYVADKKEIFQSFPNNARLLKVEKNLDLIWRYCCEKCDADEGCSKEYCKREKNIRTACVTELYVGAFFRAGISSEYRNNFIIKGGFLIASMVGLNSRATMDMDATIKRYPVSEETIQKMVEEIIKINLEDEITFTFKSIGEIREGDEYTGYRVALSANYPPMAVL